MKADRTAIPLKALWSPLRAAFVAYLSFGLIKSAEHFGATSIEAGFIILIAAICWSTYAILDVIGIAADSNLRKIDELIEHLNSIRR